MKPIVVIAGVFCLVSLPAVGAEPRAPKQISADQAIACIKAATTAKAGSLRELEVKVEGNRTVCEVELIAADGKKFEVYVDVVSGKVIRTEAD